MIKLIVVGLLLCIFEVAFGKQQLLHEVLFVAGVFFSGWMIGNYEEWERHQ
ncbi:MAG: hypothetical protein H9855_03395 [Candidatus Acinetobacter avistercoris]|nr:hypothetical protein [Candidatus Acinetobacter avistercoris]